MLVLAVFDVDEVQQRLLALEVFRRYVVAQGLRPPAWVDSDRVALAGLDSALSNDRSRQGPTTLAISGDWAEGPAVTPLLLTYDQTAELLSVSKRTVERLVAAGRLERLDVGERSPRIHRDEVEAYARSLRQASSERPVPDPDRLRRRARFKAVVGGGGDDAGEAG